ncbi:MAG TPA: M20/M25/M40 family metallo-hydrolase, partial [Lacipirellulaceae bacterium]|nr:M20/M25/M40 family metallo-hydrolase [Lacipirellulaceae bacterium]
SVSHSPVQLMMPSLDTNPDSIVSRRILEICRDAVAPGIQLQGVPFGTDAAWAGQRCPAIVLGPGDIRFAHAVDEEIQISELATAVDVYQRIMLEPFAELP